MRGNLSAIHDDDLLSFLDHLGVRGRIERGELFCFCCHDPVSTESLAALFPDSGTIKAVCGKPACLLALVRWRDEKSNG